MITDEEVFGRIRQIHVDGVMDWGDDYEASLAALQGRIGCLAVELTHVSHTTVGVTAPLNDVKYYSLEMPLFGPPNRFRITKDDIEGADGECYYLVAYCATILPLVEFRWHSISLGSDGKRVRANFDLFDKDWLARHPEQDAFVLDVVAATEKCGWQIIGPELTEQKPPADWPWPLASYDYQDGDYLIRDYLIRGMRDY